MYTVIWISSPACFYITLLPVFLEKNDKSLVTLLPTSCPRPLNTFCTVPVPKTTEAGMMVSVTGVNDDGALPPAFM